MDGTACRSSRFVRRRTAPRRERPRHGSRASHRPAGVLPGEAPLPAGRTLDAHGARGPLDLPARLGARGRGAAHLRLSDLDRPRAGRDAAAGGERAPSVAPGEPRLRADGRARLLALAPVRRRPLELRVDLLLGRVREADRRGRAAGGSRPERRAGRAGRGRPERRRVLRDRDQGVPARGWDRYPRSDRGHRRPGLRRRRRAGDQRSGLGAARTGAGGGRRAARLRHRERPHPPDRSGDGPRSARSPRSGSRTGWRSPRTGRSTSPRPGRTASCT